ncbi:non-ribosomal peptide synthetase [Aquimarina longa]|uniref:non-ribosomal peptide synthetase n=1 Tax=Aquimarina longa TaxID=1080221 RepID=UPI00078633FD|nr:non-ribosomal peptide synthetase [Aquimarina longa]
MNVEILNILKEAHNKKVKIGANEGKLTIKSIDPIDSDLLQKIKENKVQIIKYIEKRQVKNRKNVLTKVSSYNRDAIHKIPLSFNQERLWFLDQLQGSTEYHIPTVLRLEGSLDISILGQTLQKIVSRHEVLRSLLLSEGGIGYQQVISAEAWSLDREVVSDELLLRNSLQNYLMHPFDLSKDYKLRACLYVLGNDQYVLACVFHHIASDGWSEGILVHEFMELYSSLQSGKDANLPELSLQYSDYAIWQRKYLEGAVLENQLSYWEEKLKGVSTLSLPTDYTRPSVQSNAGANTFFELDKELSNSLEALCQEEGVTLFMLLLSAFKVLLSRYSGQDDICVGTPIANRTQSELEGMIGFFVNTLALRSDLSGEPSFKDVLARVKQTTLEGYDHQLAPFEKVVDRVITTRDMSITPLFQVMFVLQNASYVSEGNEISLEGVTLSGYEFDTITSKFDLLLNVSEGDNGISLNIGYCTALFDKATINRMLLHYQELLTSIVNDITQPISNLSILTTQEEHQLLNTFNATLVDHPKDKTVVDLFQEQVKRTPKAVAVVYEGKELNYQELDERSNQLANYLLSDTNISTNCLIGVVLDRSDWLIISFLAILKAGAVYVPIDLSYPEGRKEYIKKDSNCDIIIDALLLEAFKQDNSKYRSDLDKVVIKPDDLAYIIYTSGSTGQPKGVMIEHRNIVNTIVSQIAAFSLTNKDSCLQFASISFDASIWEICISLFSGCRLCIIKEEAKSDITSFRNFIENNAITFATLPPAFLHLLSVEDLESVKTLVTAGESIPLELAKTFSQHYNYINAYGPTETSICSTTFQESIENLVSIGKPIDNTQVYIINEKHNLLPIGVIGELCIGGAGVARGYLNREKLTREKFIANPFVEGERIYKTGDLARWLPSGNIEFVGRADDQVKIRGYRIELGEIENALSSLSSIIQCCVLAKEDVIGTKRLVGYVVIEGELNKKEILGQLKLSLPEYMIPQLWVELDTMPLNSNGKLDKKALPDPNNSALSTHEYVAPRNETEEQLVTIWQTLLGVERIGIHDNFFELGGHSLLVVQLISRLQALDFNIRVKDIFAGPTIASISDKLSSISLVYNVPANGITITSEYITPSMVPLVNFSQSDLDKIETMVLGGVSNIQDIYPLSPLQEGIHFHHLMSNPDQGDLYIVPSLLSFSDLEKRTAFIEALQFVVNRHDVLRTCVLSDGLPSAVQVVLREALLSVDGLDLDISKDILPQLELLIASGGHWMDISKAPLLELKSADDPKNECYYLIIYQHHLIMDHVGLEKITEEVMLYLSKEEVNLPAPFLYREFIGHTLHAQSINDGESYFRTLLGTIEEPTYPFNLSNVLGDGTGIEESIVILSKDLSGTLRNICASLSISPAVFFHAAFGLVIARCSNKEHALFGSLFSGRLQGSLGAADSLGLFINTLPVVLEVKGSVREYLEQVKEGLQNLLSYEQTPLSHIHDWSSIPNEMAFFSALLNYRHSSSLSEEDNAIDVDLGITLIGGHERTNYPFNLSVDDFGVDFGLTVLVDGSIGADRILAYMEQSLIQLIEGLRSEEEVSVNSLSILHKEEAHQLLNIFNDTSVDYPKDKTVVDLFQEQVKRTPKAVAVIYEGEELNYQELDKRSNQLAHYLLSNSNIGTSSLIGVTLDRSDWLIISFLAILKIGRAYVPIDPSYPEERKEYIQKDSNCSIIIDGLLLDSFKENSFKYSDNLPEVIIKTTDLAYVIYTSGTTGKPKGVMVEHSSIINLCFNIINTFQINQFTTCSQLISVSFDASVSEIYPSLISGSKLHIVNDEIKKSSTLIDYIKINKINHLTISSDLFGQMIWERLPVLKSVHVGGGVSSYNTLNEWRDVEILVNGYGPTETTVCATMHDFKEGDLNTNIGKPLDNTEVYVLDSSNSLVPIGVIGELCIGGTGVARGYLNQEALTTEKFISNPFKEGERIYKTGDLARWLPDGNLEFVGRKDDQVKIRGYRIELGEIENVLSSLSGVIHCCVLAKEDGIGTKRLVGYVVLEGALDKEELQEQLKVSLPEYMVPMIWVSLDRMPLTGNGKLDKKALPDPDSSELSTQEYVAPRNDTEEQLVVIWQELLGVERVGIEDNFFELGGHSLLATRLVSMIRKELHIEISIREVFVHTTISRLAEHVLAQSKGVLLPSIEVMDRPVRIPLSFSQERLWFLDQLQGSTEYHIPIVLRLEGSLDISILEQTIQEIVSRHEVLRSLLFSEEGIGYQEIIGAEDWSLDREEVSSEMLLKNNLEDYLIRPFDLSKEYKLRSCLYTLGGDQYVLACVFHHIASDGWSEGILVDEFMELYSAIQSGRSAVLTELHLQYTDYAIWQRKYLEGAVLEDQLSYWEDQLKGVSTLSLPTDYVRPSIQSNAGANISFELDQELSSSLSNLCQEEGVTMFMLLLSAFKILLSRYSGQEDICVGTPIANRTQSELEGMIGFFVNTLALRSDLSGDPSFQDVLRSVKQTTLEGYDHQLVPFEKVVDRVVTTRDMSMSPLFQVLFDFQKTEGSSGEDGLGLEGIAISDYEFDIATAQFDLTLSVSEGDHGISLGINYSTALFDQGTIDRMLLHYQVLLRSISKDITQPIGSLSMLSVEEESQLLDVFNNTNVSYPLNKTVVDLFEEQVRRTPDAIAVVYEGKELSYQELDKRSNQLGHYLLEQGVQGDDLIGICLNRSLEMLIGILGILKSGGGYVPIKPDFPLDRISYLVKDIGCTLLLTDSSSAGILESLLDNITIVVLKDSSAVYADYSADSLGISYSPDSLSYVIYTSGSTGKPKGAMIEHCGLLNHLLVMIDELDMNSDSVVAFTAPFTFDISVWQLLSGLLCGGRIAIYSERMILDTYDFQDGLSTYGVTHLQLVPSYVLGLLETGSSKGLEDLHYFLVTGEAATPSLLRSWFSLYPSIPVVNAYGPAEASDDVSLHIMEESPESIVVPIGKPIANMSLYVVDGFDRLCPIGIVGELWVSGVGVGRGYLNQEALTTEKFISNPFKEGERIYKTGDLARWLPDGNLEFIGRKDDQVKIRGYRIELGEIENVLSSLSGVIHCCVLAKEDGIGTKRLVGYVVLEGALDKEELQEQLKVSLPEYMVPMIWVSLDRMPLTGNGKLDKKALPDPDSSELSTQEYVAPRNDTEEQLVVIWQELLGVERVGIEDNFFELGGHSLLATRLVSMIRKELHIEISIREVFVHTTISRLAEHVLTQSKGVLLPSIEVMDRPVRIPLSFSQERLWFLDQLQGSTEYHIPIVLRLEGSLDILILEQTLQEIVSRHEVLRSLLFSEEGIGYQEIIGAEDWSLDREEVSSEMVLKNNLEDYLIRPFDLSKEYKLRSCLYALGGDQYVLACVFHHIASDGWSEGILVDEFMELYSVLQSGRSADLPELHLQYSDYAIWQRKYLEGAVLEDQLSYWEDKLKGVSTLSLPTDYVRPSIQSNAGANISFELGQELSSSLRNLCKEEGVTMFMLLLSAFKVLLSRYSGQEDICVGTPIANRTQSELEGMIGFFVNTLALRSDLSGDPSFQDVLRSVKQTTLEGYDHQLVPFEKVVDRVVTTRDMSMSPLFQVLFDFQKTEESSGEDRLGLEGIAISDYEFDVVTTQFDLILSVSEGDHDISLSINYSTALFNKDTIDRIQAHYQILLKSISRDITQSIGSLSMLSVEEESQLLDVFNNTNVSYPIDKTVVDLFEEQVRRTPDAIAIVYEGKELSYQELDKRSNQLGHYLLYSCNINRGDLIGVVLDRSDRLIISFLAILKIGAAYIPIDPNFPEERKEYIKKDSNCSIVIDALLMDSFKEHSSEDIDDLSMLTIKPDDLAYVIYTSGSTGKPKGVMVEHKNLIHLCFWHQKEYSVTSRSRGTLFSGIGFDASVWEIYPYLLFGATLYPISEKFGYDLDQLSAFLIEHTITHTYIPTLLCESFIDQEISLPNSIVLTGGDTLHVNKSSDITIYNNYGPTETTVVATNYKISNTPMIKVPIGKPIDNTQIYIVNEHHQLLPINVFGELCIGGSGVSRGYLNQEALTKEKFVPNPFKEGERIYKTGDLARWLPDGNLEFMGRKDDQVKIRGYRIELGEIEHVLSLLSGVVHCCVLAKEDGIGTNRLIGYVVLDGILDKEELQEQLKLSLPEYMIPMIWVSLDTMPLTSNGKLDKKALPTPDSSELSTREYVAPRNETEEQLAGIWQGLLGVDKVGIQDDFFELGGHSLLATRLVSMIRKELHIEVSIREIFEYTTISALGKHLSIQSEGVLLPSIVVADRSARIPLSFSQERLWFLDQLQGSTEYHIPIVLRLEGTLDISILEQTLQEIVSRHEILRSLLLSEEGTGYQEIIGAEDWSLDREEIPDEIVLESNLESYLMHPFDLSKEYKLRACLYVLGDEHYVLACVFHHIASDGWSGGILVDEFMELYNALQSGRSAALTELRLQYADYAIWQRKYLEGAVLEDQLSYWEDKLKGVSTLSLPTDYVRPSVQSNAGANISFELDQELSSSLGILCQEEGVTLFMLLLSAFKVLLSRYSGQDDICVGTPIANRTQSELEGMIGFFANTLALRSDLSGNPSFQDVLRRVKQTTLEGYDHQLVPFEKVVDRVVTTRDMSMSPLFQVLFDFQNEVKNSGEEEALEGITISDYEFDTITAQFDLILSVSKNYKGISLGINYSTALFEKATMDRMLLHYKELLVSITSDITQSIGNLSILSAQEEHQLLDVFNDTTVSYPKDKTIVDLFEEQVKHTPEATAIVFDGKIMTYKELDDKSNQLVHYLKSVGVVRDSRIAILFNRSFDMIIGMLGVLKSGCTYIPLDPSLPSNRLSYILEDSSVNFLLHSEESLLSSLSVSEFIFFLDITESSTYESSFISHEIEPTSLAYIMYTSGTTGNPKGVMITHRNIVSLCKSCDYIPLGLDTIWLSTGSISFDATTLEFWGTLLNGGQLILADTSTLLDIKSLKKIIIKQEVTTMWMTASWFHQIVEDDVSIFEPLTYLLVGGDVVLSTYTNKLKTLYPDLHIINGYGPTENTTFSTTYNIDEVTYTNLPIGKPIKNRKVYITDSKLNLLPIGVVGELSVGGSGVAVGYLNQETLTKEKFISNPFIEGERIYKTGDLARWLPDGNLEFVGRKDDQVKIRGYRIELGEIESVLSSLLGVVQCCVLVKEDGIGTKRLVGYVVLESTLDKEDIQEQLKLSLPEYMIPMIWVSLEALPLTSNGKLDKEALPDPESSQLSTQEYVAPRNETEEKLVEIWQGLLGVERIGIEDDFFELGGHSLLVVKLVARINEVFITDISINIAFEYATISEFVKNMHSTDRFKDSLMIPLQETGNLKTIYLAPPGSGTINCYIELAKLLGKDESIYAFQCPGLYGKSPVSASIEEMASEFITEMQKVDPYGPYRLGGYSFGAIIAYEMALQLRNKGFLVEELLIFDGEVSFGDNSTIDRDKVFREFLQEQTEIFGEEFDWSDLTLENKSKEEQLEAVSKLLRDSEFKISEEELKGRLEVNFSNENYSYLDKFEEKLDAKVILFKTVYTQIEKDGEIVVVKNDINEYDYGWNRFTNKEVIVHSIAATHMTILDKEHVEQIFECLQQQENFTYE